jgi:hypothetical protein
MRQGRTWRRPGSRDLLLSASVLWAVVVATSAGLPVVGAGLDKFFMSKGDRAAWYDRLLGWWLWLEDNPLQRLLPVVAERIARLVDRLLGTGAGPGGFLKRSTLTTFAFAIICAQLGRAWDYGLGLHLLRPNPNFVRYAALFPILALVYYPFNTLTLVLSRWVLRRVRTSGALEGILWLVLNAGLAAALAWFCAALVVPGRILVGLASPSPFDPLSCLRYYPIWLIENFRQTHSHKYLLMAASMLLPILTFSTLLVLLLICRLALNLAKRFLHVLIEENAPNQLPVFTALAFLVSLGNAIGAATVQVAKVVSQ